MYPMTGERELHKQKGFFSSKNKYKFMLYCLCLTKSSEGFLHTGSENKAVSCPLCAEIFLGDSDEKVGSCTCVCVWGAIEGRSISYPGDMEGYLIPLRRHLANKTIV